MNSIQNIIVQHPVALKIFVAGFGAWMALAIFDIGMTANQVKSAWDLATSEALGG